MEAPATRKAIALDEAELERNGEQRLDDADRRAAGREPARAAAARGCRSASRVVTPCADASRANRVPSSRAHDRAKNNKTSAMRGIFKSS